ncbi:MAG: response regulator [Selenomonadaceae bacterium]|nr:response regulator [Selenomonadaceae bacterium]
MDKMHCRIDWAEDGQKAVEMFKSSGRYYYDVILMDIQMPVMDGYHATEAIRALDRDDAKEIPIIALTASAFKDDISEAIRYGMNAYIAKPIIKENMYRTIADVIRNKH